MAIGKTNAISLGIDTDNIALLNRENTFEKTQTIIPSSNDIALNLVRQGATNIVGRFYTANNNLWITAESYLILGAGDEKGSLIGTKRINLDGTSGDLFPNDTKIQSLGETSSQWKDLYLSNNLSDGTNSATISQIVEALTIERLGE